MIKKFLRKIIFAKLSSYINKLELALVDSITDGTTWKVFCYRLPVPTPKHLTLRKKTSMISGSYVSLLMAGLDGRLWLLLFRSLHHKRNICFMVIIIIVTTLKSRSIPSSSFSAACAYIMKTLTCKCKAPLPLRVLVISTPGLW